jgi:hypothetical protein
VQPVTAQPPISVTDEGLNVLMYYAEPLLPVDRSAFLRDVADGLRRYEVIDDGVLTRIARDVQRKYRRPPDLAHGGGTSKYR